MSETNEPRGPSGPNDSGADSRMTNHGPNNHLTLIYEDRREQFATAIPFVQRGIERGERCLYVVDDNSRAEVVAALEDAGVDVDAAVDAGVLTIQSGPEVYLQDGEFDPDEMLAFLDETVDEAVESQGFEHVRITGEMTWVLNGTEHFDALADYETKLNEFYPDKAITGLCQYNRTRFPSRVLQRVVQTHPQVVHEGTLSQNFFYTPPEQLFAGDADTEGVRRVDAVLRQARTTHELATRESGLAALTDASASLLSATPDEIATLAVNNVREVLDVPAVAVFRADADRRSLSPTTAADGEASFDLADFRDRLWEVFVSNESARFADGFEGASGGPGSLLVVPLGRHGVLAVASSDDATFDGADVDFVETIAANVEAAFDRVDRERMLGERERTVERQEALLERLTRVNELVRDTAQALVAASSHGEIRETVCDRLARAGAYRFVWFGDCDRVGTGVTPAAQAGVSRSYLDAVDLAGPADDGAEPAVRAATTGDVQVVDRVFERPASPWEREAFRRDFRSVVAVPIEYDGVRYGVVTIYADEPNAFDDVEREALAVLGDVVGFAINSLERKRALVDDRAVDLELRITDPTFPAIAFARRTGGTFEMLGVVPHDDEIRVFADVSGATVDDALDYASESLVVESVERIADRGDELRFEYTVDESGLVPRLLEHGVTPRSITADAERAEVVVSLPGSADTGTFVDLLASTYDGVDLLAKRTRERDAEAATGGDVVAAESLTDRQREAVLTAYYSGYFDWPRDSTGEEVARRMGVSQPTFARHLREASRKIFAGVCERLESTPE